ncbi:MAG: hypothetical protein C0507_23630 [Cyanobacteria bacterium PR.3.49]|jgi:hypothetical protein|nr:hypothetical protein [Cyanobacteria bacterium PR.3.49]
MEEALRKIFPLVIIGIIGFFIFSSCNRPQPSSELVNDSVVETVKAASLKGWRPCTNSKCLNYSKKGWHHIHMENHPDWYIWLNCGSRTYSQQHIGHIIDSVNGQPVDVGPCPTCSGTGWVEKKKPAK